jgi:predicted 2-oxoglutarate/Fe(II)-dependent dioxygenase YbiX
VIIDPADVIAERIRQELPGVRWFLDYDASISRLYGAAEGDGSQIRYFPHWILLDPMLRVQSVASITDGAAIIAELKEALSQPLPELHAPVLILPNVLPRALCADLMAFYERKGGEESGFMREENGITVIKLDRSIKQRSDATIDDEALLAPLKAHLARNLRPMVERVFQFQATRIERFIVACYDSTAGGHFRRHRDNTTMGTAHRRFAVTINLNAEDYEGGDLRFPEYGQQCYRAPTGGAVVFSCSLLHEATPVTSGRRFAFLPFLYDDAAANLREQNLAHVEPALRNYRASAS